MDPDEVVRAVHFEGLLDTIGAGSDEQRLLHWTVFIRYMMRDQSHFE